MYHSPSALVVVIRRRARRRVALALAIVGASLLLGVAVAGGIAGLAGYFLLVVGFTTLVRDRTEPALLARARGHAGSVAVRDGALHLEVGRRKAEIALDRLLQGWTAPGGWGVRAFLEERDGDVYAVELASEGDAIALLDAAGVSADKRVVTLRLAPVTQRPALGCAALIAATFATFLFVSVMVPILGIMGTFELSHLVVLGLVTLAGLVLAELSLPPVLTIGLDGFRVRTFFRKRFVPLAQVAACNDSPGGVTLETDAGTKVKLDALQRVDGKDAVLALRAVVARALAASSQARTSSRAAEALGRRGERFPDWMARVKRLGKSGGYREGTLGAEVLAEVMVDAQAPADRRLGAAISLAELAGEAGRARARVAPEAPPDVATRAALEAAAEQELTEPLAMRALRRDES